MTVCAAVLVAGAAAAQETPSFPARDLPAAYDTYPRLSFHDVSLGYGVMPINDVTGIMDDLLPSLVGTGEIAKRKTGSVNMGYMYRLTPSLTVGGMFVYSGNMSSTVGGGYICISTQHPAAGEVRVVPERYRGPLFPSGGRRADCRSACSRSGRR